MTNTISTPAFDEAYAMLNVQQKEAVDTIEGPVMVIAGPGTGKTQILTLRIANILRQTQADPENILALTFTNSGVQAMRKRLRGYIGDEAYRVGIYTFHSFAEHVLQKYRAYFPAQEFANVISEIEKAKLIEAILEQHDFTEIVSTYDRFSSLKQVMSGIGDIKQEGLRPDEFEASIAPWEEEQLQADTMFYKRASGPHKVGDVKPTERQKVQKRVAKVREIATVFAAYQRALKEQNLYDFSDMILTVLAELESNEHLKFDLQEQYQYLLVDEHQDTNDGQNKLIEQLADAPHLDGRPNLFTVGDEKQAIYRFQGASDAAFSHFKQQYQDVEIIELEQNYRSTAPILASSHELITKSLPTAQALVSNMIDERLIAVREFSDYKFELLFVANDIADKIASGVSPDEISIIYRSNKHLLEIKSLLQARNVPYQVRSRDTLLDDPAIQNLLLLVRVIHNPLDDHSLGKVLFADFLGLDALMVAKTLNAFHLAKRSDQRPASLVAFLESDERYQTLLQLITQLQTYEANHTFAETFKELLQQSGFLHALLQKPDSRSALRKVEVLFNEFKQQSERSLSYRAADFLTFIDAVLSYSLNIEVTAAQVGVGVQCMTAHGSKGLEFEHVYMLNTAMTNWEKSRGFSSITLPMERYKSDLDDERRLFYVALTRAKTHLAVSSSKQDWSGKALEPSRFIAELGTEHVELVDTAAFETAQESALVEFFGNPTIEDSVFNTTYLAERFRSENLSVTSLNNYLDCPIKYLFRNLIQLPDVYTPTLRYGNAVHGALEHFFTESHTAGSVLQKETLFAHYQTAMQAAGFTATDYDTFLRKGRQSLGMYYDYYQSDWSVSVTLETYIRRTLALPDIELTLSGKIDKLEYLRTFGTGPVRVVDYKTGKAFSKKSTKAQKQALERQIQFYHLLLDGYKQGDVYVESAMLDFVEPTDSGEFEQKTLQVTAADLTALQSEIAAMAASVLDGSFLTKGCAKKDCQHCAFFATVQR